MPTKLMPLWLPFGFSAALSLIAVVTNIGGMFFTGKSDAGMIPYLCFLPMAFYLLAESQRQTRQQIQFLESRIMELEGHKVSVEPSAAA